MDKVSGDFSFSWSGKIWQMAADSDANRLALEVRSVEDQTIHYELLNLSDLSRQSYEIAQSDWWTMLLRMSGSLLFLERYGDPQDPSQKDLLIYDLSKNELHVELKQFQLLDIQNGQVLGHEPSDRNKSREYDVSDVLVTDSNKSGKMIHPVYYAPNSEAYKTVMTYLDVSNSGVGCEYLEYHEYIIISYYVRLGTKFDRKLLVIENESERYHQQVDRGMSGFASGGFFILNSYLIFIKNGNEINGIEL